MRWRKTVYEIIEPSQGESIASMIYDYSMIIVIIASLVPLAFKETSRLLDIIQIIAAAVFAADYILRLITADLKLKQGGRSFLKYPFTLMAIIDLVSLLPTLLPLSSALGLLRLFKIIRFLRVFRVLKMLRYSKSVTIIMNVIRNQRVPLITVCTMAVTYVLLSALVMFNVEPDTFESFFDAVYLAMISLTTVGYGDIYPVSVAGRAVAMISSFVGIAIVALPSGIITAGYMKEVSKAALSDEDE